MGAPQTAVQDQLPAGRGHRRLAPPPLSHPRPASRLRCASAPAQQRGSGEGDADRAKETGQESAVSSASGGLWRTPIATQLTASH
jgi:hypothetical protein